MIETIPVRVRTGRVLGLGALSSFGPLALDPLLPGLPKIAAELGTTEAAAQLSLSACMIGLALGQLLAGPLTDRVGRRRVLVLGVALFVVMSGSAALAPSIQALLVLRLLGGLGGGFGIVIARSMARDLYDGPALARVYSLLTLVNGVTVVGAPLLGGHLLATDGWRAVFVAMAAIGAVLVLVAVAQRETLPVDRRRGSGPRETGRALRDLTRNRAFVLPTTVMCLGLCAMFTCNAMSSFVLQHSYGLDVSTFSAVSAGNALGLVLFSQLSALLATRFRPSVLLTTGVVLALLAATAMLVGVVVSNSLPALLLPLFVLISCTGLIGPNATALALDRQGAAAGSAAAVLGLAQFGVAAVVPPVASLGGVSPVAMAIASVATAAGAALTHAIAVRTIAPQAPTRPTPGAGPSEAAGNPARNALLAIAPGHPLSRPPVAPGEPSQDALLDRARPHGPGDPRIRWLAARPGPPPAPGAAPAAATGRGRPSRLQWVVIGQPGPGGAAGGASGEADTDRFELLDTDPIGVPGSTGGR